MVVKMAKIMKSRRLRKRVRKTLGALFLASAIAVAAIPVDGLQASGESAGDLVVTVGDKESGIPILKSDEKVYATGDGVFQFAYVSDDSHNPHDGTRNAVIVGYNPPTNLEGNTLVIPNEVEVYDLFTSNLGSGGRGYVAVGKAGNFLFWRKDTPVLDVNGNPTYEQKQESRQFYVLTDGREVEVDGCSPGDLNFRKPLQDTNSDGTPKVDGDGNPVYVTDLSGNPVYVTITKTVSVNDPEKPIVRSEYLPCYYSDKNANGWGEYQLEDFYTLKDTDENGNKLDNNNYDSTNSNHFERVGVNEEKQWITHVAVAYIGNQSVTTGTGGVTTIGPWITYDNNSTQKGVFQGKSGNVVNLSVGENLIGIGNYAFADCSSLQSITLGNGLKAIGNHAFDSCINIRQINVDPHSNLEKIGDHAFYNCQSLRSFNMPVPVKKIGDGVFENCYALAEIGLYDENEIKALDTIGEHAFMNCRSLTSLTIPSNVTSKKLGLSMVYGCSALQSVTVINEQANFVESKNSVDGPDYTFEDFKNSVPATFYFEGVNTAYTGDTPLNDTLHKTANDNSIAFKYLNQDVYEIVIKDPDDPTKKAIYRVNSSNQLIYCHLDNGMSTVEMPSTIGPYRITAINSTSFQNNCALKKITIPSSVLTIEENAFRGCHNLKDVIFESPVQCAIGANAFKTQDVSTNTHRDCADSNLADVPTLSFTGDISYASGPFVYAMDPSNNINAGSQQRTYITYYSGWPTNLTVKYNEETDKNELIDYPIFAELSTYDLTTFPYMTQEYVDAAKEAVSVYDRDPQTLTDYQRQIINSALNIELPQGIESVKDGLFKDKESKDSRDKTITTRGIAEILPNTFEGCTNLKELYILGDTSSIGDYAFKDCTNLETVEISANVNTMGVRPFAGCQNVSYVSFQDGPNFRCENSIIYGLNNGAKSTVAECLEARGRTSGSTSVKAEELAGVIGIAKEAFFNTGVGIVDLKESSITEVPEYAFAGDTTDKSKNTSGGLTNELFAVYLPKTCQQIKENAFKNSKISAVEIPSSVSYIDPKAFNTTGNSPRDVATDTSIPNDPSVEWDGIYRDEPHTIEFSCENPSTAYMYATSPSNSNINPIDKPLEVYVKVTFVAPKDPANPVGEYDTLDIQEILLGEDAVPPNDKLPVFEGYTFQGWYPSYEGIGRDTTIEARYKANDLEESKVTVTFMDEDGVTVLGTDRVFPGEDAKAPVVPSKEGYRFVGWAPPITNIQHDTTVIARYDKIDSDETRYIVNFYAWNEETGRNDKLIATQRIAPGEMVTNPQVPTRPGYSFTGWLPDVSNITGNVDTYAQYDYSGPGAPTPTPDPNATPNPNATPTPVPGATPTPGATATPAPSNPNATPTPSPSPVPGIYTLTVRNGSGSGSYVVGAQVIVIADNPSNNSEFSGWTVEPATAVVASKDAMGTVLIMPASNVVMTANYKSKTNMGNSSTVTRPNGTTGNGNGNGSGTSTNTGNGTTLVITKNGLSNTGKASVTVNGSSDNFVVKISEDANATEAALKALMNEYGELTNISYFPMDISLYDSTGTTKITDTTGLAVDITLPIPDSLIPYAGNNKVASVVNNRLEKLTPKFTTIDGVPCISFTATHFSPYVIYVDTTDLSAGTIQDSTPKTGDGIHPKWFLAMGLACISFMLFIKKDKRAVPVKVAAAR